MYAFPQFLFAVVYISFLQQFFNHWDYNLQFVVEKHCDYPLISKQLAKK